MEKRFTVAEMLDFALYYKHHHNINGVELEEAFANWHLKTSNQRMLAELQAVNVEMLKASELESV